MRTATLPPIEERLIVSLYDKTGNWAQPYIDAGYPVILWDKQCEGDVLGEDFWREVMHLQESIYGILAAPPCDDFAASGARWWEEKDKDVERIELSCALAEWVWMIQQWCPNLRFWVMENPVGRLETLLPVFKPYRRMSFHPCDFGEPYTKKTILWGEFNVALPRNPVLPLYGSMMQQLYGSKHKNQRSATPGGFARAFFKANP